MFSSLKDHSAAQSTIARILWKPDCERSRRWSGLLIAVLLAWGLMLIELTEVFHRVMGLSRSSRVGGAVLRDTLESSVLQWEIAGFIGAQLFLHAMFGVVLWLLAKVTTRALPSLRLRFVWIVAIWCVLLGAWMYIANATLFHDTLAGPALGFVRMEIAWRLSIYDVLTVIVASAVAFVVLRAVLLSPARRNVTRGALYLSLVGLCIFLIDVLPELRAHDEDGVVPAKPHVILIGVDSLRPDMVGIQQDAWFTPAINKFLRESHVFPDAITPLARTFPSWMTILSGRHPVATGARDNLVPFNRVDATRLLPQRLRDQGYRTVYATDDVRFSNIDEQYGFDEIIGPRMGASDFLLGSFNDMPLPNLIANTWLGAWLFPNTYGNRAAEVTYRPSTFNDWLEEELSFDAPTFLSVHLTLAHNPYTWAHDSHDAFAGTVDSPYPYLAAIAAVDKQFAALMRLLEQRGALNNAIVVLLSDHGEGLGLRADNLFPSKEAKAAAERTMVWMWGHGTSVLSPQQYSVVLAFRRFHARNYTSAGASHADIPASLEDIAPTVLELAGVAHSASDFDGLSLAQSLISGGESPHGIRERTRFTETGISTALLKQGQPLDKQALVAEGGFYFEVDGPSGRVQLRTDQWDYLITGKERAAMMGDWLLAAIPIEGAKAHRYLFVSRHGGVPKVFHERPTTDTDPVAAQLWTALQRRYPGELTEAPLQ